MTNHVHLLITPETPNGPAKLMQSVGRRYVQYVNRFHQRSGSLWEGRFKSSAVQTEEYLLLCQRYIKLNPVRAGMVSDPARCRWPRYRHNGLGQADPRLTRHPLYVALGNDDESRLSAYRALFRGELDAEAIADIRLALMQGQPLGSERFKEAISSVTGVRHTRTRRGRPEKAAKPARIEGQTDFGF
jgi:putative transposase